MSKPNPAKLLHWLLSWVQPNGAIHGFHNHSVWGGNPYRWADFTCDHSTWASPLIPALAHAIRQQPDRRGIDLLTRLIRYQANDFQKDGNYNHIGFQVGETLKHGLIHNVITNASLADAVRIAGTLLDNETIEQVRAAFDRNSASHGRADPNGCCNQEYARVWSRLLYDAAFEENRFGDEARQDLHRLGNAFVIQGIPDGDASGCLRNADDASLIEPAEYYGLMIMPLVMGYERFGDQAFLDQAIKMCKHVARSAWKDKSGHIRMHRLYHQISKQWVCVNEPMLIAGMGDTLEGIDRCLRHVNDDELSEFVISAIDTYAAYQHPGGFFQSASGWNSEIDIAPSSAWHAHDARFLMSRIVPEPDFWDKTLTPCDGKTHVLLGSQCYWVERGHRWAIADYKTQDVFVLHGRKDRKTFGRDMKWVGGSRALKDEMIFQDLPEFIRLDNRIVPINPSPNLVVINASGLFFD